MKVLCILSDGFEELEAVGVIALLRRANIYTDVITIQDTQATGRFQITLANLKRFDDIVISDYDMLFLPGGPHYETLEANEDVQNCISFFIQQKDKYIAAICAAPTILGRQGYLKGKTYTCFPSMKEDFGGTYLDTYCVKDGNLITGRSVAAVIDFAFSIIETLQGTSAAQELKSAIYY